MGGLPVRVLLLLLLLLLPQPLHIAVDATRVQRQVLYTTWLQYGGLVDGYALTSKVQSV